MPPAPAMEDPAVYESWVRGALRSRFHEDTLAAFTSLQEPSKLASLQTQSGDHEDVRLHSTYAEGQRHTIHDTPVTFGGADPSARLPLALLGDKAVQAYYAGRQSFSSDYVSAAEVAASLSTQFPGQPAGRGTLSQAAALIASHSSAPYLVADGRLFWADFERFYARGPDPRFDALAAAASPVADASPPSLAAAKAARTVATQAARLSAREDARRRAAAAAARTARALAMVTHRLGREAAIVEARRAASESTTDGHPHGAVRVTLVITEPRLPAALTDPASGVVGPAVGLSIVAPIPSLPATLAALERTSGGVVDAADVALALAQRGVPLSPSELHLVAREHAAQPADGSPHASGVDYCSLLRALGYAPEAATPAAARAALVSWEAATRAGVAASIGRQPAVEDLTPFLIHEPASPAVADTSIADVLRRYSVAGFGHPVFHAPAFLKLTGALSPAWEAFRQHLRALDKWEDGAVAAGDVGYALRACRLPTRRTALLAAAFPAPPAPDAPPGALGRIPRVSYVPLAAAMTPARASLGAEKRARGVDASSPVYDGDIDAGLTEVSSRLWAGYVTLRSSLESLDTAGGGALPLEDITAALTGAGVDGWDAADAAFVLSHFHGLHDRSVRYGVLMEAVGAALTHTLSPFA